MNPKEKAIELLDKFRYVNMQCDSYNKDCALLCVNEIINALYEFDDRTEDYLKEEFDFEYNSCELQNMDGDFRYWDNVKMEINKL